MTDTTLTNATVFPQDNGTGVADGSEDGDYAAYFGLLSAHTQGEYVENGSLAFDNVVTTDGSESVDIGAGTCYVFDNVNRSGGDRSDRPEFGAGSSTNTYDTKVPLESPMIYAVVNSASQTINLASDATVDVYLFLDPTSQDSVSIRHGSGVSDPETDSTPKPSIKLGTVNTADGSKTRANDKPDITAGSVDADDLSVTNAPYVIGESQNLRAEIGTEDLGEISAASDATWDTSNSATVSVSFASAFSSAPKVAVGPPNRFITYQTNNVSTTGFDLIGENFTTSSKDPNPTGWIAVGPD